MKKVHLLLIAAELTLLSGALSADDFDGFDEFETQEIQKKVSDPFYHYNVQMTRFNDAAYTYVMFPLARGYKTVTPKPVRKSISRFLYHLGFPTRFLNSVLQVKFHKAGLELSRFTINSTLGLLGFFDPADNWVGIHRPSPESFGQTLGHYGVPRGPYLVLPLLGPSSVRSTFGLAGNNISDPINYVDEPEVVIGYHTLNVMDRTTQIMPQYTQLKEMSFDFYTFMRDAYIQREKKLVDN